MRWKGVLLLAMLMLFCLGIPLIGMGQEGTQQTDVYPKIGLALSGGGARGFAHIGALKVLNELDIPIDYIAGTSMGALVGALYAAGYSIEELDLIIEKVKWEEIFSDTPPRRMWSLLEKRNASKYLAGVEFTKKGLKLPKGLTKGQKISTLFSFLTMPVSNVTNFDRLPIPYRAVAADIENGEQVVLSQGNLADAMRASMSVPGVFTPVDIDGRILVDGGIVKNLPVDVVKEMGADIVIAVDVSSELLSRDRLENPIDILNQMVGLQILNVTQEQRKLADVMILTELGEYSSGDFTKGREIADLGEQSTRKHLDRLQTLSEAIRQTRPDAHAVAHSVRQYFQDAYIEDVILEETSRQPRENSIYKYFLQEKDTALNLELLERAVLTIFSSGQYESVSFSLDPGETTNGRILRLRLQEKPEHPYLARFGMYYESRQGEEVPDKMVMLLNATFNGFSGKRSWWSTDVQFVNVLKLRTQYYQPLGKRFFLLPEAYYDDDFQMVYRDQKALANYDTTETGAGLSLGALLTKLGFLAIGYNWEDAEANPTADLDSEDFPRFDENITSVIVRSNFDRLDRFPFPHSGELLELNYQWASQDLGGDVDYHKFSVEAWRYFGPATRHTLGFHLLAGSDFRSDLRPYKKFIAGGRESFVGYKVEELRGTNIGIAGLEYRYQFSELPSPLGQGIYATLIGNVGNTWQSLDEVQEDFKLRYGGSIGVAVDSIIGPIMVDFSLGDEGRKVVYVNVGLKF